MEIIKENDHFYLNDNGNKTLINDGLMAAVTACYGENIPDTVVSSLPNFNAIASLSNLGYEVDFFSQGNGIDFKVTENVDGFSQEISMAQAVSILKQEAIKRKANRPTTLLPDKEPVIRNVSAFNSVKPKKRFKLSKGIKRVTAIVLTAAVTAALAVGAANLQYVLNAKAVDDYMATHSAATEQIQIVDENTETADLSIPLGVDEGHLYDGDVVAYISGNGLDKEYPVMQSDTSNPNLYLHADVNGNYSAPGNIYKSAYNNEGLSDEFVVVFGHNNPDGSQFSPLVPFADKITSSGEVIKGQDFYNSLSPEEKQITMYDEYNKSVGEIAAAGVYDGEEVLSHIGNFSSVEEKQAFIDYINNNSDINCENKLTIDSTIYAQQVCSDPDDMQYYGNSVENENNRIYIFYDMKPEVKFKDFTNQNTSKTSFDNNINSVSSSVAAHK